MAKIYMITNTINNKKYIGKTDKSIEYRFSQHINSKKWGRDTYIGNAIAKYGSDNFKIELIAEVEDWEYWEQYYINHYKTFDNNFGYNITLGGDYNPMSSPSAVERHRVACSSEDFREKQRLKSLGVKHSEETKRLCREATLKNIDVCLVGWREYNDKRKVRIGMLDLSGEIIKEFASASDACRYLDKPTTEASRLISYCDKYNKNGNRSKFWGRHWKKL